MCYMKYIQFENLSLLLPRLHQLIIYHIKDFLKQLLIDYMNISDFTIPQIM